MNTYIGTKVIRATPMTRLDYNEFRGWTVPADENPADDGYLVEYLDGGKPNTATHAGYVSWSPKEQFEKAYRETSGLTFGLAIEALKLGERVTRAGWNGKGMWIWMPEPLDEFCTKVFVCGDEEFEARPWIGMKTADDQFVPWVASQSDMLAEDWQIVE